MLYVSSGKLPGPGQNALIIGDTERKADPALPCCTAGKALPSSAVLYPACPLPACEEDAHRSNPGSSPYPFSGWHGRPGG